MSAVEAVVETAEVIDDVVEAVEHINNFNGTTRKQQLIIIGSVVVITACVTGVATHFVTNKILKTKYERLMEEELEKTRVFYHEQIARAQLEAPEADPEEMLAEVQEQEDSGNEFLKSETEKSEMLARLQEASAAGREARAVAKKEAEAKNVFEEDQEPSWIESNDRRKLMKKPYVLTKDEFFENDEELFQITFTYFDGDGVLADEKEDVITDSEPIVGEENLARFGWLSDDKNTVYIRNPDLSVDIEVIRSEGSYAQEVLGFKHGTDTFERHGRKRVSSGED